MWQDPNLAYIFKCMVPKVAKLSKNDKYDINNPFLVFLDHPRAAGAKEKIRDFWPIPNAGRGDS